LRRTSKLSTLERPRILGSFLFVSVRYERFDFKIVKLQQDRNLSTKFYNVCRLFFGLVECTEGEVLQRIVGKGMEKKFQLLFKIHCALECQQVEFCNEVTGK